MFLINPYILGGGAVANPLWNDLLAYYTADNTPNDALGNYNGTLTNGATYGTGIINNGFSLDGVNDYINMGNILDFDGTTPFSFNFWVNPNAATANSIFISKYSGGAGYLIRKSTNGNYINISVKSGPTTYFSFSSNSITVPPNSLSMITVTYNGTPHISGVKIYVNSISDTLISLYNSFTGSASNSSNFILGSFSSSKNLSGIIATFDFII